MWSARDFFLSAVFAMVRCMGTRVCTHMVAMLSLLAPCMTQSQSQRDSATLGGYVRDARGHPVASASVQLETEDGSKTLTTHTDSTGSYQFPVLKAGVYKLRAEMSGSGEASVGPCAVGQNEAKKVDLTLDLQNASAPKVPAPEGPEFFDQPEFTVAAVTDTTNLGGHGSNTTARATNALTQDVRSLDTDLLKINSSSRAPQVPSVQEAALRTAVEREPGSFEANHRLGALLVEEGKAPDAVSYFERASQLRSLDYNNSYDLAFAYASAGKYEWARTKARALLVVQESANQDRGPQDKARVHHLLASIDEKLGDSLEAVHEYQSAAELSPTEPNLFDWGTELLTHHAVEPAITVFTKGNHRFPRSARMLVGLGVSSYAVRSYDEAAQRLCEASDLNPDDPAPYLVLGKIESGGNAGSEAVVKRLERFARMQPDNAMANYYYALSLWNGRRSSGSIADPAQVEWLLEKSVHLDPHLGSGYLQLGIVYADRGDFAKAIPAYQKAIEASPELEEAHYRLAQAYRRTGETEKAQAEIQVYKRASKTLEEQSERERREVRQFVYTLRDPTPSERR
jgi:tetratricopeptide (TPR) repeat protein